jgi:all-trans-8'-apo-beta-carotenal 15,15'-oxygenase
MQTIENEVIEPAIRPRAWRGAFTDVTREHGFIPLRVEGKIPTELRGTLHRNGPGLFSCFDLRYEHWFDADGVISSVRFDDGRAEGAVRLLETPGLLEERRKGKAYFGLYGTQAPGMWSPIRAVRSIRGNTKNPSNTSVLAWAGRTFALCEIGRPLEFDPNDLSSIGETDLGGVIPRSFSAHPHRVAKNGYVYNIGVRITRPAKLDLFALRPDGTSGRITTLDLPFATMIHDFAATERFLVILVAPLNLHMLRTLFARGSFVENMRWQPERGTEVIVVPLDAPSSPIRFKTDAFWAWHIANAYESGDDIVMDLVHHDDFARSNEWLTALTHDGPKTDSGGLLRRARLSPKRELLQFEAAASQRTGEYPRVAPSVEGRRHTSVYWSEHSSKDAGRDGPPNSVVRADVESGKTDRFVCAAGQYPTEGVFIPRSVSSRQESETHGWLVAQIYDGGSHTTSWAVFDAAHLADGPIARAHLDHHVPLSFHGAWVGR